MSEFNYPKKSAFSLAEKMRKFRSNTETTAYSEINHKADEDRVEVVRQIDWKSFDDVLTQLEFCYLQQRKEKKL